MSNTESAHTQWKQMAESIGFPDEKTMWQQLYNVEGRTISELAKTLGYGTATLSRRIALCGVDKRSRGGANSPSRIVAHLSKLDQRFVRTASPRELADILDVSVHSVYRLMKEI